MAEKMTAYQCPACTGPLHFDGSTGKLKCDYCGSLYDTAEIEEMYKEAAETAAAAGQEEAQNSESDGWGEYAEHMRAYHCTTCGAELVCEETTAATNCPYCGNPAIIPASFSGILKPEYVIPFVYEKKKAVESLKDYYKGKTLLPNSFASENHLEKVQGVYVPFWMYDMTVEATGTFNGRMIRHFRRGNEEIEETRHYEVRREGTISFEKIPVDASTKMPDDLMDSIEPFNYSEIRDFEMAYMPGYLADRYDVDSDTCFKKARERAEETARTELEATVQGYNKVDTESHTERVLKSDFSYAMLPVYLLSTKWQDRNYLFAMNGQTGKMIGNLPVSKGKTAAWFIGIWAVLFMIFNLITGAFSEPGILWETALFALIPTAIVMLIMIGQMKPVAQESSAGRYTAGGSGIKLDVRTDNYIRTTEKRKRINSGNNGPGPGGAR